MESTINFRMITLARELRGFTQEQLAIEAQISQGKLSKIEQDLHIVNADTLEKLCKVLKYPKEFFLCSYPIIGNTNFFRKRSKLGIKQINKIKAKGIFFSIQLRKLLLSVDFSEPFSPFPKMDNTFTPEDYAKNLRKIWEVPNGPIDNLTNLLENKGAIIIYFDFETELIDGFSFYQSELPPIIYINTNIPVDRQRFTLAHELGHVIMHEIVTSESEGEADRFAAEFLMPEEDIYKYLEYFDKRILGDLKRYWKVSMASILYRAKTLGAITYDVYLDLIKWFSSQGYRKKEPIALTSETPTLLKEIIDVHINKLGYSISDLAKVLLVTEEEFINTFYSEKKIFKIKNIF